MTEDMDTDRLAKILAAEFVETFLAEHEGEPYERLFDLMRRAWQDGYDWGKESRDE